ncbi:hypothetical protein [Streptomyces sp. NPDC029003]|uniref:hypothetical protein n=1 Tax=Streptomyces sp. NPDC029003 TaxID=3155125 RepID=UPI0033C143C9
MPQREAGEENAPRLAAALPGGPGGRGGSVVESVTHGPLSLDVLEELSGRS